MTQSLSNDGWVDGFYNKIDRKRCHTDSDALITIALARGTMQNLQKKRCSTLYTQKIMQQN